ELAPNPYNGLFATLLAPDDAATRAAVLKRIREHGLEFNYGGQSRQTLCELAAVYERVAVKKEVEPAAAVALVQGVMSRCQPFDRENASYFAGRILEALGKAEAARDYFEACAASKNEIKCTVLLARARVAGAKAR